MSLIQVVPAETSHLDVINALIIESRSIWEYPADYETASRSLILVDEDFLKNSLSFEIYSLGQLVGFLAFVKRENSIWFEHLWISRKSIRQGLGKAAIEFSDQLALKKNWKEVFVYPDPPAEKFYLKFGYVDTGERAPSRIDNGPTFSLFKKSF